LKKHKSRLEAPPVRAASQASGLQLLTPATVHYGHAAQLISKRQAVLDVAYHAHPERFVRRAPQHPSLPDAVWINPPASNKENTP
jgi:putative transposase